ncbi:unnamed protein product [marine sediment metagenome]|uniref:Uncharacterized protein n=1 Tax=marine sediment metagenome TaxID=412755 RepID=X1DFL6_9ZZZZ
MTNKFKNWIIEKSLINKTVEKERLNRLENYISTPVVTSGLTNGIFLCCSLLLNSGDYIISTNKRMDY